MGLTKTRNASIEKKKEKNKLEYENPNRITKTFSNTERMNMLKYTPMNISFHNSRVSGTR